MISTYQDYSELLHRIQSLNLPSLAILLPKDEKIYNIDLNTRKIEAPPYLSVEKDHRAEAIYFKVSRFYDNYDLLNSVCIIQYINAKKESRAYVVPYFDATTLQESDEIIFPWLIDNEVAKIGGTITFNVRFYQLTEQKIEDTYHFLYNLNTLPATSKILTGIKVNENEMDNVENDYYATAYNELLQRVNTLTGDFHIFWEEN